MANKPGYDESDLLYYIFECVWESFPGAGRNTTVKDLERQLERGSQSPFGEFIEKELKGLKIRFERPDGAKRDYRVNGFGPHCDNTCAVTKESGKKLSIAQYFQEDYKKTLKYPKYPSLWVGSRDPNAKIKLHLPLELCRLKKQPAPNSKKLTDKQTAEMIKFTAIKPEERMKRIQQGLRDLNNNGKGDPFAKAFGITVEDNFQKISGRVLPAPKLAYRDERKPDDRKAPKPEIQPKDGKWDLARARHHFVDSRSLNHWGILDLAGKFSFHVL